MTTRDKNHLWAYYVFEQRHRDYGEGVLTHANLAPGVSTVLGDYSHSGRDVSVQILVDWLV